MTPSRYIEFENIENAHRPYNEIVADINRIVTEKNNCKLTINETIAKSLGFDIELFKQDNSTNNDFSKLTEKYVAKRLLKTIISKQLRTK